MATIILRAPLSRISGNFGRELLRGSKRGMRETNESRQGLHTCHKTSFSRAHQVRRVHLSNLQLILALEATIMVKPKQLCIHSLGEIGLIFQ